LPKNRNHSRVLPEFETAVARMAPITVEVDGIRWVVRSKEILPEIEKILRQPDALLTGNQDVIKTTPSATIARLPLDTTKGQRWMLRKTKYGKARHVRRDMLRPSGPMRAFNAALMLEEAGVATPKVLAAGIQRKFHKPVAGYLLVEEIFPSSSFLQIFKNGGKVNAATVKRVAQLVAKLHKGRVVHGDLKDRNILLDGALQPWLVDLDRARKTWLPVGVGAAALDLYQLARAVYDYGARVRVTSWRFVRDYCQARGWEGRERELAKATLAVARRKIRWTKPAP
jgi:tRNA A-37 threonylcarbamoyl transferase component Bud32